MAEVMAEVMERAMRYELHPRNTDFQWRQPEAPLRRLSPAQMQAYGDDGYVAVCDAFSAAEVAAPRAVPTTAIRWRRRRKQFCGRGITARSELRAPARSRFDRIWSRSQMPCADFPVTRCCWIFVTT